VRLVVVVAEDVLVDLGHRVQPVRRLLCLIEIIPVPTL
jgi:hypothetical protein